MKTNNNLDFNNLKKETIDIGMTYEDVLLMFDIILVCLTRVN
jgi:hypothetical protein